MASDGLHRNLPFPILTIVLNLGKVAAQEEKRFLKKGEAKNRIKTSGAASHRRIPGTSMDIKKLQPEAGLAKVKSARVLKPKEQKPSSQLVLIGNNTKCSTNVFLPTSNPLVSSLKTLNRQVHRKNISEM